MATVNTVALDAAVRPPLLTRIVPDATALTAWPTPPPDVVPPELHAAAERIRGQLDGGPGYVVIDTGLAGEADVELVSAAWNLFTVLYAPVPQYHTGELLFPVEVSAAPQGTPGISHYSMSNATGGFHTDGTLLDVAPDAAALLCLSAADEGGETLLMDGWRLLEELDHRFAAVLSKPHWFHSGDPATPLRTQPVAGSTAGRTELRYLRRYIVEGYAQAGEPMPEELTAALDALDGLSQRESAQIPVPLRRGEILLWANGRFIHGRRGFVERQQRRRLRRMYGVRHTAY